MIFDVRRMEEMVYIVVPIFNTEKYLEQCLKSIHKQHIRIGNVCL